MDLTTLFMSPAEMSLEQAMSEGMHAGLMGRSWAVNPYQSSVPEHAKWEEGRRMAEKTILAGMTAVSA